MKDENGALLVGAIHHADRVLMESYADPKGAEHYIKEKLFAHIGFELSKAFPVEKLETASAFGTEYRTRLIAMTMDDYNKLAEYKWMYEGLNK